LWEIFAWWPCALYFGYVMAALIIDRGRNRQPIGDEWWSFAGLLVLWLIVPTFIAWTATQTNFAHLFFPRYLISCSLAAILLAACCAGLPRDRWSRLIVSIAIFASALGSSGIIAQVRHDGRLIGDRAEDWRRAVAWLNEHLSQASYPVLVASGLIEADGLRQPHDPFLDDYCLLPATSLYPLMVDRGDLIPLPMREPGRLDQTTEIIVAHRGGAWLVVRGTRELGERIAARIVVSLNGSNVPGTNMRWRIKEAKSFGRVQVLLLAVETTN